MQVVITMAGRGSRFQRVGYTQPKHEIMVHDRSLFEWALDSLSDFKTEKFVFVVRQGAYDRDQLKRLIAAAGIGNYEIIPIDAVTSGQAATVMAAMPALNPHEGVAIYNIDTYVEPGHILRADLVGCDGHLTTFKAPGDHWSFIKLDDQKHVVDVVEKRRISDLASVGFYYFDRFVDFAGLYHHHAADVRRDYGETYVAPFYHYFIQEHRGTVTVKTIPTDAVHVLGTPEELTVFRDEVPAE
ncbi:glycosyltransferase family 2 protein [Levilactobacillus acidifarinae]|nr:glycosyltransferase family 2 protein [Levilactobacillus acidifarinae]GEO68602.1 hypothetical protein LAC03_05120 [Levilactobacillus acidifarinae]